MRNDTSVKLKETIRDIDCLAASAFDEIVFIANLVLKNMEDPNASMELEHCAQALMSIMDKASSGRDWVGSAADEVGCAYVDERAVRRQAAQQIREKATP